MDLSSLRSTIIEHQRPSGRLAISPALRAQILESYAAWRQQKGTQQEFLATLGLKTSTFASWLTAAKSSDKGTSTSKASSRDFRQVKVTPQPKKQKRLCVMFPNGVQLKGLSLEQALVLVEAFP